MRPPLRLVRRSTGVRARGVVDGSPPDPEPLQQAMLPFELIREISRLLLANRNDLSSASLVSKFWRAASRRHLFHEVFLNKEERVRDLLRRVDEEQEMGFWIHKLRFLDVTEFRHGGLEWIYRAMPVLSLRLPHLKSIEFEQLLPFRPTVGFDKAFFEGLSAFTLVETLVIRNSFAPFWVICALVAAFPNLKHVYLRDAFDPVPFAEDRQQRLALHLHQPKLHSLHFQYPLDINRDFLKFVSNASDVEWPAWESIPDPKTSVFKAVPSTLREITLPSASFNSKLMDLAPVLPNLTTLRIAINDDCWEAMFFSEMFLSIFRGSKNLSCLELINVEFPQCQHLIHLFPRDTILELIVFNLRVDCLRQIENKDTLLLDLLLTFPSRFKALREVRFRYEGQSSCTEDVSEKLRRVFPGLVRNELLSIAAGSRIF